MRLSDARLLAAPPPLVMRLSDARLQHCTCYAPSLHILCPIMAHIRYHNWALHWCSLSRPDAIGNFPPGTEAAGKRLDTCPLASPGPTVYIRVVDYPRRASGNIYISEVGGGVQPGNRFVSCRACVRACARCGWSGGITAKSTGAAFPFSL